MRSGRNRSDEPGNGVVASRRRWSERNRLDQRDWVDGAFDELGNVATFRNPEDQRLVGAFRREIGFEFLAKEPRLRAYDVVFIRVVIL